MRGRSGEDHLAVDVTEIRNKEQTAPRGRELPPSPRPGRQLRSPQSSEAQVPGSLVCAHGPGPQRGPPNLGLAPEPLPGPHHACPGQTQLVSSVGAESRPVPATGSCFPDQARARPAKSHLGTTTRWATPEQRALLLAAGHPVSRILSHSSTRQESFHSPDPSSSNSHISCSLPCLN